jgi:hypothetical protein
MTGAADAMVKSWWWGERLKNLVHILFNKEPSLVAGQSQTALAGTGIRRNSEEFGGIRRNPEESGGIQRNPE